MRQERALLQRKEFGAAFRRVGLGGERVELVEERFAVGILFVERFEHILDREPDRFRIRPAVVCGERRLRERERRRE